MNDSLQVIVVGLGSAGDVHPNIGLALALRKRGHNVLLLAPSVFRSSAERSGLEFEPLLTDDDWYATINDPDLWHPWKSFSVVARRLILPALRPVYQAIAARSSRGRTVVAAPGMAFGARIAHEKLGVPLATVHLQPVLFRSVVEPPCFAFPHLIGGMPQWLRRAYLRAADALLIDPLLSKETNSFRAELGLLPISRFFDGWIHSPQLIIGMFPEWFASPPPDWPANVNLVGFPLWDDGQQAHPSEQLSEFLESGAPPIVFTAGTAMTQGRDFFRVSAEVCRANNWRGIFLTRFGDQLPSELPPQVRHFDYIPFSSVLPKAAAIIHHGGIGTIAQAIAAGIPQLIVPSTHDQPDNALRIQRLGLGDYLVPKQYTPGNAAEVLSRLLGSSLKSVCEQRARDVSNAEPLESACELLEKLTVGDRAYATEK